jgi:hypothetical protein
VIQSPITSFLWFGEISTKKKALPHIAASSYDTIRNSILINWLILCILYHGDYYAFFPVVCRMCQVQQLRFHFRRHHRHSVTSSHQIALYISSLLHYNALTVLFPHTSECAHKIHSTYSVLLSYLVYFASTHPPPFIIFSAGQRFQAVHL